MNFYTTTIQAINPHNGELTTYMGPCVPGISLGDAQEFCDRNDLGYCKVHGILVDIIVIEAPKTEMQRRLSEQVAHLN